MSLVLAGALALAFLPACSGGMKGGMKGGGMMMSIKQIMAKKKMLPHDTNVDVSIKQAPGKVVYWVLPGPRKLDPALFGTPDNPKRTAELPAGAPAALKALVKKLPILLGVPVMARNVSADGKSFTTTKMPTPFGDKGIPVKGSFALTFNDRRKADKAGPPAMTPDDVRGTIVFSDPAGNQYSLKPMLVIQPPVPGYETAGGVLLNGEHHGDTGTGTPLMPKTYTYAAFWSFGNVMINGKLADKMKLIHCMTTQIVRDKDYHLAQTSDLPLPLSNTIAGQAHHTHCIVLPIKMTPQGPVHDPVKTAFKLPNGMKQPFIHIMYEQDEIVKGPAWPARLGPEKAPTTAAAATGSR